MGKATRAEVYKAIDVEREYQERLPSDRTDGHSHTVGDYLTMMRVYQNRAESDWTENAGDALALDEIRKVAAIAVRCMEEHGAVERKDKPAATHDPLLTMFVAAFGADSRRATP